jgi:hypothetical protein
VALCPPQIPNGLTRDRTRASAVGGRRLTAWAMTRPLNCSYLACGKRPGFTAPEASLSCSKETNSSLCLVSNESNPSPNTVFS